MPEIRVSRSAGQSWNTKFAPGAQQTPVSESTAVADITAIANRAGPLGTSTTVTAPITLSALTDVNLNNISPGDVLRYENSMWRNYNETNLTDGGNF